MSSEADVIIIGAGAAGLSAAKELTRLGLSYEVVEGSHRIGGRAYGFKNLHEIRYDVRLLTNRGFRNRVI
jgi:monoamine oxidase